MEKLDAARERIEDGLERIETARRSESILNDQQRSALRREGNKIVTDGKRDAMNAWRTEFGRQTGEATALTNAGVKMLTDKAAAGSAERLGAAQMQQRAQQAAQEQGGQNARVAAQLQSGERMGLAQIQSQKDIAAMLPAELRGAMLLGTGATQAERLRSGIPALMELRDRMTDTKIAELYTKHVADAKKDMQPPMTPEEFAKTIRSAMGAYRPTVADVPNTRAR